MSRRLNPKQRSWLLRFLQQYPYYEVKSIVDDLDGDRILLLVGIEQLPLPLVPEMEGAYPGYRCHELKVKIRKYGDARYSSIHHCTTVYPHCDLDKKPIVVKQSGQLLLPIATAVLEIPEPVNPVIVNWKPKQKLKPKPGIQLSLPIAGVEAELYRLRQQTRPYLPPVSSQELLAEKVETWSLRDSRLVEVPQVLLDLLRSHSANEDESQNAIDLFEVAGLRGATIYVDNLPDWRKRSNTTVSTVAASQSVQTAKIKATTDLLSVKTQN